MENESVLLLSRIKNGDRDAAKTLFDSYVGRLVGLARNHLSERLQRRVDPEDVVQSALRSFFRRAEDGDFIVQRSGDLWRLLAAITVTKARGQARHHTAAKRHIHKEEAPSVPYNCQPELLTKEPSAEEMCILLEELDAVRSSLSSLHREILELRARGLEVSEVAKELDCTERTVYRANEKYESLLLHRLTEVQNPSKS